MKFQIKAFDLITKQEAEFLYDNMTHGITDAEGQPFSFPEEVIRDPRLSVYVSALSFSSKSREAKERLDVRYSLASQQGSPLFFDHNNPLRGKSRKFSKLKLQIGLACNYRCKYCLQAGDRKLAKQPNEEQVEKLFSMFDAAGVGPEEGALVDFWGGEPLVYSNLLKKLIAKVRRHWGEKTVLNIFTNGVLLNHEMTDFLVENKVRVSISHDGPGFSLRDQQDPLDDEKIRSEWLYLFRKSTQAGFPMNFFSVIGPRNCDLFELRNFFHTRFHPSVRFHFGGAAAEFAGLPDECLIDEFAAEQFRKSLLEAVVCEPGQWQGAERRIFNIMGQILNRIPASQIRYHCNAVDSRVLCVNLFGDVLSCQNRSAPHYSIGHMSAFEGISNPLFKHWSARSQCPQCLVLGACKGGCPDLTDEQQARCCINEFSFHFGHFYVAWYLLTGTLIRDVFPEVPFPKFPKRIEIKHRK